MRSNPSSATKWAYDWTSCGLSRPGLLLLKTLHHGFLAFLLHSTRTLLTRREKEGVS